MNWIKLTLLAVWLTAPLTSAAAEGPFDPVAEESMEVGRPYESPLQFGLDLKYRPVQFPNLSPGQGNGAQLAFEWMPAIPYRHYIGKPTFGMSVAPGRIKDIDITAAVVGLTTIAVAAHFAYRLDFFDRQFLVPFAKVARAVTFERRSPGGNSRSNSWDYSVGAEFLLNGLDSRSARSLDASTGINSTYLIVEWAKSVSIARTSKDDLSREEWQIGLRFEM